VFDDDVSMKVGHIMFGRPSNSVGLDINNLFCDIVPREVWKMHCLCVQTNGMVPEEVYMEKAFWGYACVL
jgi:hypothetical protein